MFLGQIYEYPIRLKGWGEVYPDFTVLNVEKRKQIYWEHLGMMDNPEYVENIPPLRLFVRHKRLLLVAYSMF